MKHLNLQKLLLLVLLLLLLQQKLLFLKLIGVSATATAKTNVHTATIPSTPTLSTLSPG